MKLQFLQQILRNTRTRLILAIAAGVIALILTVLVSNGTFDGPDPQEQIGLAWIKPVGSETAYAGNQACQECHAREFRNHAASPHSHTAQLIPLQQERPEFHSSQTVTDERSGAVYTVRQGAGVNEVVATLGAQNKAATARWIFGSGTHARTYVAQDGDKFLQLRITHYTADNTWNFTPGSVLGAPIEKALGDAYTPGQVAACFGCHSTVLTGSRQHLDFDHSILNVGCESCHGPSRLHVESEKNAEKNAGSGAGSQATIIKPPLHDGAQIMQLCGSCHRFPVAVKDENAASETQLARFPGVALPRSRCFIASNGKLSCITCHNPHQSTKQQQLKSFDDKCIGCHTAPHGTSCSRNMKSNCVNCHMPAEPVARNLPLRFHNHWIRKQPHSSVENRLD